MLRFTIIALSVLLSSLGHATTVQVETNLGNFQINLYDKKTPKTVKNFLSYVESGAYENTVIHRVVKGFVVQGGGFELDDKDQLARVFTKPPVVNEPLFSSLKGTIAMAKLGGQPNSATSQWFINLSDNSTILDNQNDGFTVFGEVMGDGMTVVMAVGDLFTATLGSLADFPLVEYTKDDLAMKVVPEPQKNFVIVKNVLVLDADEGTADDITPVKNTLRKTKKKSGGALPLSWLAVLAMSFAMTRRRRHAS